MAQHRLVEMDVADLHRLYVAKVERKGRTRGEVDEILMWLTGRDRAALTASLAGGVDVGTFLATAPAMNPARELVTGKVCGVRVEEVEDPTMREIRRLDKMIDEVAQGRPMERILRRPT